MKIIICLLALLSFSAEAATRNYLSLPKGGDYRPVMSIRDSGTIFYGSDIGYKINDCSSLEYSCIRHDEFVFSFPYFTVSLGQEWKIEEITFTILSLEQLYVFGSDSEVYVVSDDKNNIFYYSMDFGLLGYVFQSVLYLSEGKMGYKIN